MSFRVKGHRSATRAAYRLAQNTVYALTAPELDVREIVSRLGYVCLLQQPLFLKDEADGSTYTFTVDLYVKEHRIAILVDGVYHYTDRQQRKNEWRVRLLKANLYKVLVVDAYHTETRERRAKLRPLLEESMRRLKTGESQAERLT